MFSTPVWNKRESLGPLAPQARLVSALASLVKSLTSLAGIATRLVAMLRSLVSAIKHMDNVAVGTEKFI